MSSYSFLYAREEQEHRVFKCLLQMIPELVDRLTDGSKEEIEHIAQLVRRLQFLSSYKLNAHRYKKVHRVPDPTILKV